MSRTVSSLCLAAAATAVNAFWPPRAPRTSSSLHFSSTGAPESGSRQLLGAAFPVGHPLRSLLQGLGNRGCLVARRGGAELANQLGKFSGLDRSAQGGQGGSADLRIRVAGRFPQGGGRRREVPPPGQLNEDYPGRAAGAGQPLGDEAVDHRTLLAVDRRQGRLRNGGILLQGRFQQERGAHRLVDLLQGAEGIDPHLFGAVLRGVDDQGDDACITAIGQGEDQQRFDVAAPPGPTRPRRPRSPPGPESPGQCSARGQSGPCRLIEAP